MGNAASLVALSDAVPGFSYTVKWNMNRSDAERKTEGLGFVCGENIYVLQNCFSGPIVRIREKTVVLGREVANRIKV